MIKFMIIVIVVCWLFMFLFPPILKFIKGIKEKKGSSTDEDSKTS